ncbi:MAG TPA: hypothetical protein VF182_20285 [Candidatus Binatia bacterium]
MSRRAIQVDHRIILYSPDDPASEVDRFQAVLKVRVTDELTGAAPNSQSVLQVKERRFFSRLGNDGLGGLVAIPRQVFPALQARNYPLHLTIGAARYQRRVVQKDIPQDFNFPGAFTPQELDIALHRAPVFIAGRTARLINNATTPLPDAQITVTGIWRTAPPANVSVPPDPANIIALAPPLYADRAPLTQSVAARDLTPVSGADKTLMDDVSASANPIRISDRSGLAVGDILMIDADDPDRVEFIAIKNLSTTAPADQPAVVSLDYPVIFSHRRNTNVRPINPQPAGVSQTITIEAWAGDACVFLNGIGALVGAHEIEITGGPGPVEYHRVKTFSATSDTEGYYRLPPLSRVAQLEIHAEKMIGAQTFHATTVFRPVYQQRDNRLDLILAA